MNTIKKLRKRAGLKQENIAGALHVTRATVSSWETGHREPRPSLLPELCRVLRCTPYELLGMDAAEN